MAGWINKRWGMLPALILIVFTLGFTRPRLHPFHVSASEIEFNATEKTLEISSKIFTDDFEAVLSRIYKTRADFSDPKLKSHTDALVSKYITTHLAVRTHGQLLPLKLFGWEVDHEAVYVYTTAPASDFDSRQLTVENTILYDLFEDQMNIVHFIVNGTRKSNKLNYPDRKLTFRF